MSHDAERLTHLPKVTQLGNDENPSLFASKAKVPFGMGTAQWSCPCVYMYECVYAVGSLWLHTLFAKVYLLSTLECLYVCTCW